LSSVLLQTVRTGLRELADASFQRRVWTGRGDVNEMSSFEEAVSTLLEDSGLKAELDRGDPVFGAELDGELSELRGVLLRIDPQRAPDEIIDDPLMADARQLAAEILTKLPGKEASPY
jgi:hypothetical protein